MVWTLFLDLLSITGKIIAPAKTPYKTLHALKEVLIQLKIGLNQNLTRFNSDYSKTTKLRAKLQQNYKLQATALKFHSPTICSFFKFCMFPPILVLNFLTHTLPLIEPLSKHISWNTKPLSRT